MSSEIKYMSSIIQSLVMPNLKFGASEDMYVRIKNDDARALLSESILSFETGGKISFDTFFNSITIDAWKQHTDLTNLKLNLHGSGQFILRFGVHRTGHAHRWLDEQVISIKLDQENIIEVPEWSKLESGLLYFSLEALDKGCLKSGFFSTNTPVKNEIKLGIVITHFNRKQYVLPAIQRIQTELLSDTNYKEKIELIVVDNSQNICSDEAQGITLIPNDNYGGSGGFTRGLLHLKDQGDFTHCLFMDDDASCEIESIRRAYSLLSFSKTDKFSVAGALLRELMPHQLFEKGAKFDKFVYPLKSGLDMRSVHDLLLAEDDRTTPDYGAWWFFAFPIKEVNYYAFPFFVRGDDIRFGLENKFNILTLNGIACWGDDFGLKHSPLTAYLDARSHLLHATFDGISLKDIVTMIARLLVAQLYSYKYASSKAIILAIKHFLMGPNFFRNNLSIDDIRKSISTYTPSEKLVPISTSDLDMTSPGNHESKFRKIIRRLTLNGHLIPSFIFNKKTVWQAKDSTGNFSQIFMYKNILYEYEPLKVGHFVQQDKTTFFKLLFEFAVKIVCLSSNFYQLRRSYLANKEELMSEQFWRGAFDENP